jgi:acetate---CoA ligase (ADP-forming)
MPDFCLLLPPFDAAEARNALLTLRVAPLFAGVRGEPPMDLDALCRTVVEVADFVSRSDGDIVSMDLNPVMVGSKGEGVVVVDALIEHR